MNLDVGRAVVDVRLDDSEDSPVFYLDMTDTEMASKLNGMQEKQRKFEVLQQKNAEAGSDEEVIETAAECAEQLKGIIAICLGDEACGQIVDYIKNGKAVEDYKIVTHLASVALALVGAVKENYADPLRKIAERKYLGAQQDDLKVV